jgi:serine/threonine-protein kinase
MPDEPRVQELLDELLDTDATPEEVCGVCPELLPVVRERWRQICRVRAELDALLPVWARGNLPTMPPEEPSLPQIPGYEVEAELGRGGMGVVFRARQLRLRRLVALKMTLAGSYASPQERERFRQEAEAVAALRHANIVQIYDVSDWAGRAYFTMELIEGGSLAQRLAGVPQPARQAAALLTTLAQAMDAAHQGGIVHRDLKPANILFTPDGTPKITDFGLARRLEGGASLTLSGMPLGTPNYMAPEQARGQSRTVGPAVDVYALGAILYELLTGRPPFRAETPTETLRQVIDQEPVPPARLNARVPRDLETVCLKCLQKEPHRRYVSAEALADDLRRFGEGRPIRARPLGLPGRSWRWCRRNPSAAALVATAIIVLGIALSGGFWLQKQQANRRAEAALREGEQRQAMEAALHEAANLEKQDRWPEARAVLESGLHLLDSGGQATFGEPLREAHADAVFVTELEEIRLLLSEGRTESPGLNPAQLYANAFERHGFRVQRLAPAELAARIRASAIRDMLLAYLHDWLYWIPDNDRGPLRAVLDRADGDQWRRSFRDADASHDNGKLLELANAPGAAAQPPLFLSGLAGRLTYIRKDAAIKFLRDAQQHYPNDFWINYLLATLLEQERPLEAIGYCHAAVAIRPSSDQAYVKLGLTLSSVGSTDEAIAAFRRAINLNPYCAVGRDLAKALAATGDWEEARAIWQKSLEHDPTNRDAWYGYAQLCLFLGREQAYDRARKALLDRFVDTSNGWVLAERTSLACLLKPSHDADAQRALELADKAIAAGARLHEADDKYLQFLKGLAMYRQERFEQAIPILAAAADKLPNRAGPRLVLAMAQFHCGLVKESRRSLSIAVRNSNWEVSAANHTTAWVNHVFRREAEALILQNPTAVLLGKRQPLDNDERLALLGICEFQRRYKTAAQLFADAFEAEPTLAEESSRECSVRAAGADQRPDQLEALNTECRYVAARCAALAGAGSGLGAEETSDQVRARRRNQAAQWLQDDLVFWRHELESDSSTQRDLARKMMMLWRVEPDLASLREPAALELLPAEEANRLTTFWRSVDSDLIDSEIKP